MIFLFTAAAQRINHFIIQNNLSLDNILAVQSMAGLEVRLEFDDLQLLKQSLSNKIINQALLIFNEDNLTDLPHSDLSLPV